MTDTPKPEEPPKPEKPAKKKDARTRGQKWRRRTIVFLITVIAIAVIGRGSVGFLLPPVLRKVAKSYGLSAEYDRLDLYAINGDVGLWNLRFSPLTGGEPVIRAAYCRGSISLLGLLQGRLDVSRAEAEDAELVVERAEDGSLPLLKQLLGPPSATPSPARPLSLDAPLKIDVLRLQNARAHVIDRSMSPVTDLSLQLNLLVSDVGALDRKTRVELHLYSPEALAALYVNATGQSKNNQIDADLAVNLYGLNLEPARAYLAPLGLVPVSNNLSAKATGKLQVKLKPATATQPADALAVTMSFDDVELTSDSQPAASVKSVKVDIPTLAPGEVRVASIAIDGVNVRAARTAQGRLRFAGIELAAAPSTQPTTKPALVASSSSSTKPASAMPIVELQNLSVTSAALSFDDALFPTAPPITATVSKLLLRHLSTDPAHAATPATLTLAAVAPGLAKTFAITGEIAAAPAVKSVTLAVTAASISPTAAAPYLAPFGVKTDLTDGQFAAKLTARAELKPDGTIVTGLALSDVSLTDAGRTLLALKRLDLTDLSLASDLSRVRLGSAAIDGPTLPLRRDSSGAFSALGFTYTPSASPAAPTTIAAVAPTTAPSAKLKLPALELGKLTWRNADITAEDLMSVPALKVVLQQLNVDATDLTLDAAATSAKPGTFRVEARAPGLIDQFLLEGTVAPAGDALAFDVTGSGDGVTLATLKPFLVPLGIEPTMHAGTLRCAASGSARQRDGTLAADLSVKTASFTDGDQKWFDLAGLRVVNATFDGKTASIDALEIDKPRLLVTRDEAALLSAFGFKQILAPPVAKAVVTKADLTAAPAPTRVDLTLPIVGRLKSFALNDALVTFRDAAVAPATDLAATVSVTAAGIAVGEDAPPANYSVHLRSAGVIDALKVEGTLKLAPHAQAFTANVIGDGISGQKLEAYLPPNIAVKMDNGSVVADAKIEIADHPAGGLKATLELTNAALHATHDATAPAADVKVLRLVADRIDLPGKVIALDEVTVAGATVAVAQDADGLTAFGLRLADAPLRAVPPAPAAAETVATTRASDIDALTARNRVTPPLLTIKTLSLQADRLSFATPALARELAVTDLTLSNSTPIELLGEDPTQRPPFDLSLKATAEELVDALAVNMRLAPFAAEPSAKLDVCATGIHAPAVTKFAPALAEMIDGNDLSDGSFVANIEAQFGFARRGMFGIDLTRDVTASIDVRDVKLTQAGIERPLAGVAGMRIERARFSPATGAVVVAAIEITKPSATLVRDAAGIHALGFTIRMPAPVTTPATAPAADAVEVAAAPKDDEPATTAAVEAAPSPEKRIDSLTISGADFLIEDHLGDSPTVLPINALDVEVKGLSTRALTEPNKPIRFSALVGAGTQPLPGRGAKKGQTEERPVFAEASASGNVTLAPVPKGYLKLSLSGLELPAIKGLASQGGVTINGGTFDFRSDVRMSGATSFEARLYPTFNELRATEPPGGPVQRFLQLPAPLDVVISTVEDSDGSITFPIIVPLEAGKLNVGAVIASAAGSVARVVGEAMVAAPLKVAKLGAMFLGADVSSDRLKAIAPVTLDFGPGESQLAADEARALADVVARMKKDATLEVTIQHALGSADVVLAEQRSSPQAPDTLALVARLRQRREELQAQQAEDLDRLRVALAAQSPAAARVAADAARAAAVSLDNTEAALDQVLDLLRPGAERQTERRTKVAALILADTRLSGVQDALLSSGLPHAADRVRKANALFNPDAAGTPGRVTLTLTRRAKK